MTVKHNWQSLTRYRLNVDTLQFKEPDVFSRLHKLCARVVGKRTASSAQSRRANRTIQNVISEKCRLDLPLIMQRFKWINCSMKLTICITLTTDSRITLPYLPFLWASAFTGGDKGEMSFWAGGSGQVTLQTSCSWEKDGLHASFDMLKVLCSPQIHQVSPVFYHFVIHTNIWCIWDFCH